MKKYSDIDIDYRINRGVDLFMEGYNCSQSVVMAFADIYNLSEDLAMRLAASFGGGIGRLRLTCGAVSGMCILAGLETSASDPKDLKGRGNNYAIVQHLLEQFKEENGSITCSELLGMKKTVKESTTPSERNAAYYASRPCSAMVASACRIYATYLSEIEA